MECFVLTNNPMVRDGGAPGIDVVFEPGGIRPVFEKAACYVASGHRLLTHPLSGSVKPGETPYKSMLLSRGTSPDVDRSSARLISNALDACDVFADKTGSYPAETLRDLQLVDCSLIRGALCSVRA